MVMPAWYDIAPRRLMLTHPMETSLRKDKKQARTIPLKPGLNKNLS